MFSKATISRTVRCVGMAMSPRMKHAIYFTQPEPELSEASRKFHEIASIRQTVGAIDGTHIAICFCE